MEERKQQLGTLKERELDLSKRELQQKERFMNSL